MELNALFNMLIAMLAYFAVLAVGIGGVLFMTRKGRRGGSNG